MPEPAKCAACEEAVTRADRICPACGTKIEQPRSNQYWNYTSLAFVVPALLFAHANWVQGIVLAVGVAVLSIALRPKGRIKRQREMAAKLSCARDFQSARQFLGCDGKSGIAVDLARKRLCLLTNDGKKVSSYIVSFRDILASELIENGRAVARTARVQDPAETVDTAARRDPSGQVLARLTGEKAAPSMIWQIDLRIVVRGKSRRPLDIVFLSSDVMSGGVAYGNKNHMALGWHRMFDGFMRRAELEDIRARPAKNISKGITRNAL